MPELDEQLEVVDENNQVIRVTTRGEIYQKGLLHRAVNVFIINSVKEIYLQKRSHKKLKYPLAWDLSTAEHVKPGETFINAAIRGLNEELGIECELKLIRGVHRQDSGDNAAGIIDNELTETYLGSFEGEIKLDPEEVASGQFLPVQQINKMISKGVLFTSWFRDEWDYLMQNNPF